MTALVQPDNAALKFDVIIIGAGINGAGIARDAAMRGLRVLLLDKGDVGGGTSSWSTRLIHGGLRYLEHREIGLVRESLRERECLLNIAPHLVRPLRLTVPIYAGARRGRWTMRAGMLAYDVLSYDKQLPRHRMLSRSETLEQLPGLSSDGLIGAAVYYDAQVEFAERLVLENALAAVAHGATVITYARVEKLLIQGEEVRGVEFTSGGQSPKSNVQSQPVHAATARSVINAAGPWIDELLLNTVPGTPRLIGGTKGSHIIVGAFPGAPANALYVEAETDHRPFFIIPWNGQYLIGTTDIPFTGDLDRVQIEEHEINYLLRETNRVIPEAVLSREKILYTYAGVRPLPYTGDTTDSEAAGITRRHFVRPHAEVNNLFSIVSGKITTYRSLAEETVDIVFKRLEQTAPACATAQATLPGGATSDFAAFSDDFEQRSDLSELTSLHLLRTYGTRASLVLKLIEEDPLLAKVFDVETGAIAAEIVFAFRHELAQTLSDCLLRRTMVGLNSTRGLEAVEAAAKIAQTHLGWSKDRAAHEIGAYRKETSRRFPRINADLKAS